MLSPFRWILLVSILLPQTARPMVRKKSPETIWPLITVAGPFPVKFNLPELAKAAVPEKMFD